MKKVRNLIFGLLAAAIVGTLGYRGLILKNLDGTTLMMGALFLLLGATTLLQNPPSAKVKDSKEILAQALGDCIRDAFADDPKLGKKFDTALNVFGANQQKAAIRRLEKLLPLCRNDTDRYAVTVVLGLCHGNLRQYDQAIYEYNKAMLITPSSTLSSNIGMCYQQQGNMEKAKSAFEYAVELDPENANAYNNLATVYFAEKNYETALDYAQQALERNPNMPQALGAAAICYGLLGDPLLHERYTTLAVANGYSKRKIDATVDALKQE